MKKISNILKCTKAKLLSGIGGKTSKMVMMPEIESFHSDITLKQFYKSEYPERYTTIKEIEKIRFEHSCFIQEKIRGR